MEDSHKDVMPSDDVSHKGPDRCQGCGVWPGQYHPPSCPIMTEDKQDNEGETDRHPHHRGQ